jgi:hypothetical protein
MTLLRNTLLTLAAISGLALSVATPTLARTICRPDGYCFNTSGRPIPYYDQPAYQGYYAYRYPPYYRYQHWRHWHHDEDYDD